MKQGRRRIAGMLVILFCGTALAFTGAKDYEVKTIPNVKLADNTNRVSNPDGILSADYVQAINEQLMLLEDSSGIEVAVVAVESIGDNDARMFATELFNYWGIGKSKKDNGLLIQLVTEPVQRSVVFETGYGLEGVLPDAICYRIQQRYMISDLKANDYGRGMLKGVVAVKEYLLASDYERENMYGSEASSGEENIPGLMYILYFALFALPFGAVIWFAAKGRKRVCPKCGEKALVTVKRKTLRRATYSSEGLILTTYRCKKCGYTEDKHQNTSRLSRGGGFSGGSWGGGSSGGGGGSWGGGSSGGGGSISRF